MNQTLISVTEAKELLAKSISVLSPVTLPLLEAARHILAKDVFASTNIPPFPQSSMDGYAIRFGDKNVVLRVMGEIVAGTSKKFFIGEGEAARIFTGAPLPDGADTVVMQEKVRVENNVVTVTDEAVTKGMNVRAKGSEVKQGSLAVQKGTLLLPAAIGFLAGIGITKVSVYPMPSVSIIVTGKELQTPGNDLSYGQVYESNSYSLTAALQQAGIKKITVASADDEIAMLTKELATALQQSDVVILTGGVSVGDYDLVVEATRQTGVQQVFHRVAQRPGKPLYFGMKGLRPVFGLPGNPSSVLSCFYNYVLPSLEMMSGKKSSVQQLSALLTQPYSKPHALTCFLKGNYQNGKATPLGAQESFRLSSFAQANCLICLKEGRSDFIEGEIVTIYLLPGQS